MPKTKIPSFISNSQYSKTGKRALLFGSKKVTILVGLLFVFGFLGLAAIVSNSGNSNALDPVKSAGDTCNRTVTSAQTQNPVAVMNTMPAYSMLCISGTFKMGVQKVTVSNVTLKSSPGTTATILGKFNVAGSYNKFMNMYVDGQGNNSGTFLLEGSASYNMIEGNSITSTAPNKKTTDPNIRQGICINVGPGGTGLSANGPKYNLITRNRIFNCGWGKYDQAIYMSNNIGNRVSDNYIYDNPMFGLQFYPDSDNAIVEYNVFDNNGAGVTFSGASTTQVSQGNSFRNNIVTNTGLQPYGVGYLAAKKEAGINHWWGGAVGTGNVSQSNCIYGNRNGPYKEDGLPKGYVAQSDAIKNDPLYVNRAAKDFRLQAGSPCSWAGPRAANSASMAR